MVRLLTLADKTAWQHYVSSSLSYDFYHTWDYHRLDKTGEAILFIFELDDVFVGMPFIKREIPDTVYYDLTSVYGYTGPICNVPFSDLLPGYISRCKEAFDLFLKEIAVVSLFYRLNPFLDQFSFVGRLMSLHDNGEVVAIDLQQDMEHQRLQYRTSTRKEIALARQSGFYTRPGAGSADILAFLDLYLGNMNRVGASDAYSFDYEYCRRLLESKDFEATLFFVFDGALAVCSAIVVHSCEVAEGFLVGTHPDYYKKGVVKLMVEETSAIARSRGLKYYNLGGGLGFKNDKLFEWKKGFSELTLPHKSVRLVLRPDIYKQLLRQRRIPEDLAVDFFPLYRYVTSHYTTIKDHVNIK